ncbi:uncharacterized protein PAC_19068 [Phialocephala subalpina]|uniref:CSI2 protein n=1 Tax=Phialocephala subalpina TaxID=576137 RepID=A0A1L7XVY8_9HELO|nr:uncharacterized protein PAC_19068 [Phialocephala subalpina]
MRLLSRSAAVAVTFAMAASAASTLPNLSTATDATGSGTATTGSGSNTASATTGSGTTAASTGSASKVTITGGSSAATTGSIPSITGTTASSDAGLTGLPTLSGAVLPVTVTVPNLANAPFMQASSLPDGTVFIVVGAVLGFMAMSVLLWRGLVAWSLHRSVKRAASQQGIDDKNALFRNPGPPPAPFYKYSDRDSTISLSGLGHKSKKSNRPNTAGARESTASLFFSPTAGAAGAGVGAGNRGSNYLPAGYYAAGASVAGNGQGHVPVGGQGLGHRNDISMSTLRPESQGYGRARSMGHSPPDSPGLHAASGHMASSSTLNLSQGYGGNERAPSAYLEDLIDGDNTIPPGHGHLRDHSNSPGRY